VSRLQFHIEQKIAQRDSIDLAARRLAGRPGVIVEFGLGKGRSYTHLRARFPGHPIVCFDRRDATHPGWGPPPEALVLGDLREVLRDPAVEARFRGQVLLAHLDLARGDSDDTALHALVVRQIRTWLRPGAWVLSDRRLPPEAAAGLQAVDTAGQVAHPERFFAYVLDAA
jgi:hypothetical protein